MQKVSETIKDFVGVESLSTEQHLNAIPTRQARDNAAVQKLQQWFQNHDSFPALKHIVFSSTGVVGGNAIDCYNAQPIGFKGIEAIIGKRFSKIYFSRKKRVLPY